MANDKELKCGSKNVWVGLTVVGAVLVIVGIAVAAGHGVEATECGGSRRPDTLQDGHPEKVTVLAG